MPFTFDARMAWRFVNGMTNLIGMGFTVPHGTVMSSYFYRRSSSSNFETLAVGPWLD